MKKLLLSISIGLILTLSASGQTDRLRTIKDTTSYQGDLKEYYQNVFTLLSSENASMIVRYIVLPSFSPEYSFAIKKDKAGSYQMVILGFSENFWYAEKKERVELKKKEIAIDQELAILLKDLYDVAIGEIKDSDEPEYGLDGVNYYFYFQNDSGSIVGGETWSPMDGTKMDKLVKVNEELLKYSYGRSKGLETLKKNIISLTDELKN